MTTFVSPKAARCDDHTLWVDLDDGRTVGVPLAWYPRLLDGSPEQRNAVELSAAGMHWEALDEDISVDGILAGRRDATNYPLKAA